VVAPGSGFEAAVGAGAGLTSTGAPGVAGGVVAGDVGAGGTYVAQPANASIEMAITHRHASRGGTRVDRV
jgi:hypothetical protein